jgi:replication-associated recombination protein RarA
MDLVMLYGPPAVGKLTIAQALTARTGLKLFHNHLVLDAITAVFEFRSPTYLRLREAI